MINKNKNAYGTVKTGYKLFSHSRNKKKNMINREKKHILKDKT